MTVPVEAPTASTARDTPKPATIWWIAYEDADALCVFSPDHLASLRERAERHDRWIAEDEATARARVAPPATDADWIPFIPEHVELAPLAPVEGGACTCTQNADIVLHVAGCTQGAAGQAQPYGPRFCADYGLTPNVLVTAAVLGAALRGISAAGLPDAMESEAEDRLSTASLRRALGPDLASFEAAEVEYRQGLAETEDLDPLFEQLRAALTAAEYDKVLDGVDLGDTAAVRAHLQARLAAARTQTRPALPGEAPGLVELEQQAAAMRKSGHNGLADSVEQQLAKMRTWPQHRVRVAAQSEPPKQKSNWREEVAPLEAKLFKMTPGLRHTAEVADALGAGRQGVLAVTLTRTSVAVGPHVRLLTASGMRGTARQGGSLNFYSALVGKPNAGKTEAADAGAYLVPLSDDALIPEGTGEGIVKSFGFMRREKHGTGEDAYYTYEFERMAEQVLMAADEVDAVFAEMCRQGTKFASMWRSMWMGAMVGTTTGNVELRTKLLPHTYRLGALLGCQPEATVALWEEGNRGTPQRIHWAPCTRRKPNGKPIPGPLDLAYQSEPEPEHVGLPNGYRPPVITTEPEISTVGNYVAPEPEPQWIEWPAAARRFIEAELEALQVDDDPYGEGDDDEEDEVMKLLGHSTFMRLKIMALLAIMDGLEQPTDTHWEAAGIVMQLREMCMRRTKARATRAGKVAAENRGVDQGIQRATAKLAEDAAVSEFSMELEVRILTVIGQLRDRYQTPTSAAIMRRCSKKQQPHVLKRLGAMCGSGALRVDKAGAYTIVPQTD
ncbi:hypothetical protein [Mycobacteroides abscessus]|uniref:hypothetical protein n=1 Tax=Mycobacteroides abscessus TaxID=36809 RepID=UPI0002E4BE10|nr:hypothetical protein [Mycobacteroides abscessus]